MRSKGRPYVEMFRKDLYSKLVSYELDKRT
jgi:hypothetical protein